MQATCGALHLSLAEVRNARSHKAECGTYCRDTSGYHCEDEQRPLAVDGLFSDFILRSSSCSIVGAHPSWIPPQRLRSYCPQSPETNSRIYRDIASRTLRRPKEIHQLTDQFIHSFIGLPCNGRREFLADEVLRSEGAKWAGEERPCTAVNRGCGFYSNRLLLSSSLLWSALSSATSYSSYSFLLFLKRDFLVERDKEEREREREKRGDVAFPAIHRAAAVASSNQNWI